MAFRTTCDSHFVMNSLKCVEKFVYDGETQKKSESESAKYSKHLYKSVTWSTCANGRNHNMKFYKERKKQKTHTHTQI